MLIFLLSTCRREYSTEGGIYTTACLNDYTASCKLLKIEYTANGVLGAANTVDLTYTGNQLTKATDNISNRTFTWQAGLIVKIEYRDAGTNFRQYTETIGYVKVNNEWKISVIKKAILNQPPGIDTFRISYNYNSSGRLTRKTLETKIWRSGVWTPQATIDFDYNSGGNIYQVRASDLTVNPSTTRTIPLTWSGNCNTWLKVFPLIELVDYEARDEMGGLSPVFFSRLFAATTNGLFTTFTLNSSHAVQKYYQDNKLIATYTYDCP